MPFLDNPPGQLAMESPLRTSRSMLVAMEICASALGCCYVAEVWPEIMWGDADGAIMGGRPGAGCAWSTFGGRSGFSDHRSGKAEGQQADGRWRALDGGKEARPRWPNPIR